jgi:hypothetical protein
MAAGSQREAGRCTCSGWCCVVGPLDRQSPSGDQPLAPEIETYLKRGSTQVDRRSLQAGDLPKAMAVARVTLDLTYRPAWR